MLKKSELKSKKPLVAKTPIKQSSGKPKTRKPHTLAWYKKEARKYFNRAIKYRDSEFIEGEWLFECITCPRRIVFIDREGKFNRSAHAGHFQSETHNNTRFNELNVNGQCNWCNSFNAGEQVKYARALEEKYGLGTALELEQLAAIDHQFTQEELEEVIRDSKEQIAFYENQVRQISY